MYHFPQRRSEGNLQKFDLQIAKTALNYLTVSINCQSSLKNLKDVVETVLNKRFRFSILPVLGKFGNNFIIECDANNRNTIKPKTVLELCKQFRGKTKVCEGDCNRLHVCKFFLLSKCSISPESKCRFGHEINSDHNRRLLEFHYLDHLGFNNLRNLFRNPSSRIGITKPPICRYYNTSGCNKGDKCIFIHICITYVKYEGCGGRCAKNHNICQPHVKGILGQYGLDVKLDVGSVLAQFRSCFSYGDERYPDSDSSSDSDDQSDSDTSFGRYDRPRFIPKNSRTRGKGGLAHSKYSQRPHKLGSKEYEDAHGNGMAPKSQSNSLFNLIRAKSNPCLCGVPQSQLSLYDLPTDTDLEPKNPDFLEICIYFIKGNCMYGDTCQRLHSSCMYQWQYKESGGKWKNFRSGDNVDIEHQYCDVDKDGCSVSFGRQGRMSIDFQQMTGKKKGVLCDIRRMATESTAVQKFQPLATEYKWFWQDQRDMWTLYGQKNVTGYSSRVDSAFIEMNYLENPKGQMKFNTSGHDYIMDFPRMVQKNVVHKTERCVRRRPVFVSLDEIEAKKRSSDMKASKASLPTVSPVATSPRNDSTSNFPTSWSLKRVANDFDICNHFQLVTCQQSGQECKDMKRLFYETMPKSCNITSIKRIENGELWLNFMSKRDKMKRKRTVGKEVTEVHLFHGTNESIVDAICRQGFDFRFSGSRVGHLYGKGSYFARMAKTADSYTDSGKKKHIFVVRVLAGDFVKGEATFVRPPPRNPKDPFELYDSCVDNVQNPDIFVIFTFDQVYPEYVIEYQKSK